jgi:DNA-binding MarR family transcriptional regulator
MPAKPSRATSPEPDLLGFRLGRLMHALRLRADDALRPQGFSMAQSGVLFFLKRVPGISNAEMARMLSVTPQAMGEKIAELEAAGLLVRRRHASHGRKLVAELTPAGLKTLAACRIVLAKIESQMLSTLKPAERERLEQLLDRCYENVSPDWKMPPGQV